MQNIKEQLEQALKSATTAEQVEQIRIDFLGRKGSITLLAKNADFSKMSVDEKKNFGRNLNELKQFATQEITKAAKACKAATVHRKSNDLDLTAPGKGRRLGALHPITLVQMELEDIFQGMGFSVVYGPEIESEYFCFEALNIPHDHPAREPAHSAHAYVGEPGPHAQAFRRADSRDLPRPLLPLRSDRPEPREHVLSVRRGRRR